MNRIKIFWWAVRHPADGQPPFYIFDSEAGTFPVTEYGVHSDRVTQLLWDGYTEISAETAHALGFPV